MIVPATTCKKDKIVGCVTSWTNFEFLFIFYQHVQDSCKRKMICGYHSWIEGNALDFPFPEFSFDVVTIGCGLQNVVDRHKALEGVYRVLKPGYRVSFVAFNKRTNPFRTSIQVCTACREVIVKPGCILSFVYSSFPLTPKLPELILRMRENFFPLKTHMSHLITL